MPPMRKRARRVAAAVRRFAHRPLRAQVLVPIAWALLGLARLAILGLSFERLAPRLGERMAESVDVLEPKDQEFARRVGWAVATASRYTPWVSNCFPQAVAAKALLRTRGIAATLYVGARFADPATDDVRERDLVAHAWLRAGERFITGGDGHRRYGAVASFA